MNSQEIIFDLWKEKKWISNDDFYNRTHSPKFTSRISDLRNKGVPIIKQMIVNPNTGKRHAEYALEDGYTN